MSIDSFIKKLKNINSENLSGFYSFDELFNKEFMNKHTQFESFNDFLKFGGWEIKTMEDFNAIPKDKFDLYIKANTDFNNWQEMKINAAKKAVFNKINK